jgi:5-amino-6-(5-phosphoribosylamino)uracil reductase
MSVDGYLDDASPDRLRLSNDQDLDRIDAERARADAILVGAGTIRRDNPRLLVRSAASRQERVARGLPPSPTRVTITDSGDLDPSHLFFTATAFPPSGPGGPPPPPGGRDEEPRLVYSSRGAADRLRPRLEGKAAVIDAGDPLDLRVVLDDLAHRGVRRLMVEGGGMVHTQFLAEGVADELQLVVAPFFVGDSSAPRFVADGAFPHDAANRMTLAETRQIGDVVLLRYLLGASRR